jgi:hypothetical protein
MLSNKRTTTTTAIERPIIMVVVGTPIANIMLIGRDTTVTRKSIREKAMISDEASPPQGRP